MNAYPSWIHRIPEMIEILGLTGAAPIDRQLVERLFDLRGTAAKALLRRMGAELCRHSFVISRCLLMARLREALENPDWQWEARRRQTIRDRIDSACRTDAVCAGIGYRWAQVVGRASSAGRSGSFDAFKRTHERGCLGQRAFSLRRAERIEPAPVGGPGRQASGSRGRAGGATKCIPSVTRRPSRRYGSHRCRW